MMRRGLLSAALLLGIAGAGGAQTTQLELPPPVLTIDSERLLEDSAFGRRLSQEFEERARALAAENREIEAELLAEERALTELRPELEPEEFRTLADAFDEKVQQLRDQQDQKERELALFRETERQSFLERVAPVLSDIVRERRALVILDRRNVFLSADSIDITEEAIRRMDEVLETPGEADPPESGEPAAEE